MKLTRLMAAGAGAMLALGMTACSGGGAGDVEPTGGAGGGEVTEGGSIGVAMPTQTTERWIADGNFVKSGLEEAGFSVDLQYAADDIPTQQQQIDNMITNGVDVLIVAAIDGTALTPQLAAAAEQGIPVIAYDRLIRDSGDVDFYVTFDNYKVGVQQGISLLTGLGILDEEGNETGETGPFNVELFAGSLDDNNAHFFWQGGIDTIQQYIDSGVLVIPSGQTEIEQAATQGWLQETAQKRMENLLTAGYVGTDLKVDGVLAPNDGLARGVITALQNNGYAGTIADGFPIVTGQDAEIASVKLISDGVQYSTVFKDTRNLAAKAIEVAEAFLAGEVPEPNDTETYDNGVKVVPSFLLESVTVLQDSVQTELIDSGYWTEEQVAAGVA